MGTFDIDYAGNHAALEQLLQSVARPGDFCTHGREVSVDMNAAEPSELVYAAFYADCTHETQQVREGYRLSLVFNLSLRPGDTETPREAPDYSDRIEDITSLLIDWRDGEYGPDKLVWVLEHNYSEAGLSFNALKNADAALATVLHQAASRAGCEVYAAILHIEEEGDARYSNGDEFDSWGGRVYDADDFEMEEVFDGRYWLDGWTGWDGGERPFSKIPLCSGELLPAGALDDAEPDENWINESTGNEGVTLEWAYRHAALVFWPGSRALDVLADAGMEHATANSVPSSRRFAEILSNRFCAFRCARNCVRTCTGKSTTIDSTCPT